MGPIAKHKFHRNHNKQNVYEIVKNLRQKILKFLNPMQRKFWYDENLVFSRITQISSRFLHLNENPLLSLKMSKEEKTDFVRSELNKIPRKMPEYIYLPTNPDRRILEIIPASAVSLQSAKKVPFIVNFVSKKYEGPDSDPIMSSMNIAQYEKEELFPVEQGLRPTGTHNNSYQGDANPNNISKMMNRSPLYTEERGILTMNNLKISSANFIKQMNLDDSIKNGPYDDEPLINDEQDNLENLNVPHLDIKMFNKHEADLKNSFELGGFNDIENDKNGADIIFNFDESNMNVNDLSGCTNEDMQDEIKNEELSMNFYFIY